MGWLTQAWRLSHCGVRTHAFWQATELLKVGAPAVPEIRRAKASFLRPKLRVRAKDLKGGEFLRHASWWSCFRQRDGKPCYGASGGSDCTPPNVLCACPRPSPMAERRHHQRPDPRPYGHGGGSLPQIRAACGPGHGDVVLRSGDACAVSRRQVQMHTLRIEADRGAAGMAESRTLVRLQVERRSTPSCALCKLGCTRVSSAPLLSRACAPRGTRFLSPILCISQVRHSWQTTRTKLVSFLRPRRPVSPRSGTGSGRRAGWHCGAVLRCNS